MSDQQEPTFSSGALPDELSVVDLSDEEVDRLNRMHDTFYGDGVPDNDRALDELAGAMDVIIAPDGDTIVLPINRDNEFEPPRAA